MAKLWPIESDDPLVGGFAVEFPSGTTKSVCWRQQAPVLPAIEGAKAFVAALIDGMLSEQGDRKTNLDDIERTNIPSLTAAVYKIVKGWNTKRRDALYAEGTTPQAVATIEHLRQSAPANAAPV